MEFMIDEKGVFKKEKKRRNRGKIRNYGDEKEMLEGDFYKPETPASPFFRSESSIMKIKNETGFKTYFCEQFKIKKNLFRPDSWCCNWTILKL